MVVKMTLFYTKISLSLPSCVDYKFYCVATTTIKCSRIDKNNFFPRTRFDRRRSQMSANASDRTGRDPSETVVHPRSNRVRGENDSVR